MYYRPFMVPSGHVRFTDLSMSRNYMQTSTMMEGSYQDADLGMPASSQVVSFRRAKSALFGVAISCATRALSMSVFTVGGCRHVRTCKRTRVADKVQKAEGRARAQFWAAHTCVALGNYSYSFFVFYPETTYTTKCWKRQLWRCAITFNETHKNRWR